MDSLLHPVGPEARTVYWTRRAVVIGVLLALIALLTAMCTRRPDAAAPTVASPASTTSTLAATSTSTSAPASPTSASTSAQAKNVTTGPTNEVRVSPSSVSATPKTTSGAGKASASTKAAPNGLCEPNQLKLTLSAYRSVKKGEPVKVRYTLTNEAKVACKVAWNDKSVSMTIVSGSDRIWTTANCAKWVPSDTVKLAAGKSVDFTVTWQGRRSKSECKLRDDARPRAGTYVIIAKMTDVATIRRALLLK